MADPFANVQLGPSGRSDARHRVSASAVVRLPWGIQVAPFFVFRSALPIFTFEGVDRNNDGNNNDITVKAYQYTGLGKAPKEIGDCAHINCSRGAPLTQLNARVSKSFRVIGNARLEAIGEVFNLFNALNPVFALTTPAPCRRGSACRLPATGRVCRRLPPIRAAHRPGGVQVHVLTGTT